MALTFEDCLSLCDISEAEALAIAEHQHIPPMAAVELGDYLTKTPEGELCLKAILREYILKHPRCEARHRAALHAPERRS